MFCKFCGAQIDDDCVICPHCGKQVGYIKSEEEFKKENNCNCNEDTCNCNNNCNDNCNCNCNNNCNDEYLTNRIFGEPINGKYKILAGLLAILLGTFGIQYFYLENNRGGILSLIFFWTGIPSLIGFIQGIIILCETDDDFARRVEKSANN